MSLALALALHAPPALAQGTDGARIEYRIAHDATARDPAWSVTIAASGLAGAREVVLELPNWGDWLRLDGYYLRGLASEPPLARSGDEARWELVVPEGWDGAFTVRYELVLADVGSPAHARYDGLPYRAGTYTYGVSANTLMQVGWTDGPERVARTLVVDVPEGWSVFTGWSGAVAPGAEIALAAATNVPIALGVPLARHRIEGSGHAAVEVTQWGGDVSVAPELCALAAGYLATCAETLGVPPTDPMRLVLTEPGHGGTRLDGAIVLGVPDGFTSPYTLHFVAHELFHDWLGGKLRSVQGESLAWFWEGFTEYLSLWHLVRAGHVSPRWFAERLREHEAELAGGGLLGRAAFADATVDWRDAELEPLAYKASALTAFALDVALRARGEAGLVVLLRDLLATDGGRYSLASLRAWFVAHGLEAFWDARIVAPCTSTLAADLVAAGWVARAEPQPLAYVGLRLDADGPFGTVVAVDPDGPSAGKVRIGDFVTGLAPTRAAVAGAEAAAPDYPFGLAYYDPDAAEVRVDVAREGVRVEVLVAPRRVDGPPLTVFEPGAAAAEFFR